MKIQSGQIIPNSEIQKIFDAFCAVKGTSEYTKYHMEIETYYPDTKSWKFLGHGVPHTNLDAKIKMYGGRIWLVFDAFRYGGRATKERYELTAAVMNLMGWEV